MEITDFKKTLKNQEVGIYATLSRINLDTPDTPDDLGEETVILNELSIVELGNFLSLEINFENMDKEQQENLFSFHDIFDKYVSILDKTNFEKEMIVLSTGITNINEYRGEILMCTSPAFWGIDDRNHMFKILFDRKLCTLINPDKSDN